jgi:calcineurin-like phosphoesterase family protein
MNIWFSSDTHYGHKRIIELAKRPFSSVEEMDEVMIERHNARVRPGDQFFHVGDFAFADHDPISVASMGRSSSSPATTTTPIV